MVIALAKWVSRGGGLGDEQCVQLAHVLRGRAYDMLLGLAITSKAARVETFGTRPLLRITGACGCSAPLWEDIATAADRVLGAH